MSLTPGTRLGPYEILASIGAGGMGEVYRARDTKLDRDVALKILPEAFARDPERLSRFGREAKHLAALNHPNIAQIYGVEDSTAIHALVMELVPGRALDAMLSGPAASNPLSVTDALAIARQLADALEAAHETGIIHRDLKPANIKVRDDGTVKVLDFGLAKALETPGAPDSGSPLSNSPTMLSPTMTQQGIILGTAPYMSPEQARGRPADKRTDVWAFGVVLYEMFTGRRLFSGESVSDAVAAVLRQDIDLAALPADLFPAVKGLIARCLDRDQRTRLRDMGEARVALLLDEKRVAPATTPSHTVAPVAHRTSRASLLPWTIAALAVIGAAAFAWSRLGSTAQGNAWDRFTQLTDQTGEETNATLSPDGASVAYGSRARGTSDIYVQRVGGRNAQLVAGDPVRHETAPAFSPDGRSIAFHESDVDGGIFIVGATGESARRLTDFGFHPAWSPDGRRIAFCTEEVSNPYIRNSTSTLWLADTAGGAPVKIFDGDAIQPTWSPDGRRIAFWSTERGQRDVKTIAAAGGTPTAVTSDPPLDWSLAWAPDGWLYFSSDRGGAMNLWRIVPSDAPAAPEPVTLGVQASISQPSFSDDGTRLVFRSMLQASNPASMSFDLASEQVGAPKLLFRRTAMLAPTSITRDGQWLALANLGERQEDIFICRVDGSGLARLTDDAARDRAPVWSPDGSQLAFYSNRGGEYQTWAIGRDGGGLHQLTASKTEGTYFPIYRPSGRMIVSANRPGRPLYEFDPARPWDDQKVIEMPLQLKAGTSYGAVDGSPDGKRLAGTMSSAAGVGLGTTIFDIGAGTLRTIGTDPTLFVAGWLPDSQRVLTITLDGRLVLFDVDSGRRRELTLPPGVRLADSMAISPDGRTIYVGILERESDIWMVERSTSSR